MDFEPAEKQEKGASSRSGLDRHQRAQAHFEKVQAELAEILAFAEQKGESSQDCYEIAKKHVCSRRNSQLTKLFKDTVVIAPPIPEQEPVITETGDKKLEGEAMADEAMKTMLTNMNEMMARMKIMEAANAELKYKLQKTEEQLAKKPESEASVKADKAMEYAADISKTVLDKLAEPKPAELMPTKLQQFRGGDFNLWADRFEAQAKNWTEEREMNELLNLLLGPAELIVKSKKRLEWSSGLQLLL